MGGWGGGHIDVWILVGKQQQALHKRSPMCEKSKTTYVIRLVKNMCPLLVVLNTCTALFKSASVFCCFVFI